MSVITNCTVRNTKTTARRYRAQRGSAIVEGALVILPLMAIGFALLDYPLAIFLQNTLRNAVREGVRYAITQQTGGSGQDAAIDGTVEANSMGFLNASDITAGTASITIQYYNPTTLTAVSGSGSNAQGNICVVTATLQHGWMVPIWKSAGLMTFTASSADVMEAPPNGVLPTR